MLHIISFTNTVKVRIKMKIAISPNLFQSFAVGLPIVRKCKVGSDKVATLTLKNDEEVKICLVISADGYPKQIRGVISGMTSDMYCVILAPYITEQTAGLCKSADVGFLNRAGNCYIA